MHICPVCIMAAITAALGLKAFTPVIKNKIYKHWCHKHKEIDQDKVKKASSTD